MGADDGCRASEEFREALEIDSSSCPCHCPVPAGIYMFIVYLFDFHEIYWLYGDDTRTLLLYFEVYGFIIKDFNIFLGTHYTVFKVLRKIRTSK